MKMVRAEGAIGWTNSGDLLSKRFGGNKGQASLFGGRVDRVGSQSSMALTINKE